MGFWKDLFGSSSEKQGYVIGSEPGIERMFGIGGDTQAVRHSNGNVYDAGGKYLGNNFPDVEGGYVGRSSPSPSSGGFHTFGSGAPTFQEQKDNPEAAARWRMDHPLGY